MDYISRKTGNVADFPLKLNLQMFADEADGTPSLEDSPEFREDAKEFDAMNAKMDKYVKEHTKETIKEVAAENTIENKPAEESKEAVKPEFAVPDDKPKQDSETNKAFQEMRQKLEAAEKANAEIEAKARKADELIAQQYGQSHGIFTVEQYEQRIKQEAEAADDERYQAAGLTPEEINKLRTVDELQTQMMQQEEQKRASEINSQWQSLYSTYNDLQESSKLFSEGKEPEWYNAEMKAEIARGASPLAAYRNAHFEAIMQNAVKGTKETAKQEALNQLNSKDHMRPSGSDGGDVDHVEIDAQQMAMYRRMTGKSDSEIRKFHKKQLAGG